VILEACRTACQLACPRHTRRCGQCYVGAYEHVQRFGGRLVHGTVRSLGLGRRIQHAWVESRGKVFDYADPAVVRATPAAEYRGELQPRATKTWSRIAAARMLVQRRTYGPWR
jgi:hypothetical protein